MTKSSPIYVKISGGDPMFRVTERMFQTAQQARDYLIEWGISLKTHGWVDVTAFGFKGYLFLLSHSITQIFTLEILPYSDVADWLSDRLKDQLRANRSYDLHDVAGRLQLPYRMVRAAFRRMTHSDSVTGAQLTEAQLKRTERYVKAYAARYGARYQLRRDPHA